MRKVLCKTGVLTMVCCLFLGLGRFDIMYAHDLKTNQAPENEKTEVLQQNEEKQQTSERHESKTETVKGIKSPQKVMLNGRDVEISAYKINDENYFKLRDIAALLTDTNKAFDVVYNKERNVVEITKNKKYQKIEGDLAPLAEGEVSGIRSPQPMEIDGVKQEIKAYKIFWNNYYRLRDLGEKLDFEVDFHRSTQKVIINSELIIPKAVPTGEIKFESYKREDGATMYKRIYPDEIMNEPMRMTYPRAQKGEIVYDILERCYFNDKGEPVDEYGKAASIVYRETMARLFKVGLFELDLRYLETIGLGGTGGDWNIN